MFEEKHANRSQSFFKSFTVSKQNMHMLNFWSRFAGQSAIIVCIFSPWNHKVLSDIFVVIWVIYILCSWIFAWSNIVALSNALLWLLCKRDFQRAVDESWYTCLWWFQQTDSEIPAGEQNKYEHTNSYSDPENLMVMG